MYRTFLRGLAAICLLYTFWPIFRFHGLTIFDCLSPLTVLCALPYRPKDRGAPLGSFILATAGVAGLAFAGIVSVIRSFDSYEHITEVALLIVALGGTVAFVYVLENRRILSAVEALTLLCASSVVCAIVVTLQGKYHMLLSLIPTEPGEGAIRPEAWTRFTGLAEHPIETGIVSAYGVVIALGLGMYTRKWLLPLIAIGLDVYSDQYSASLTAIFALTAAVGLMCIYNRAYKALVICGVIIGIGGLWVVFSSNFGLLGSRLAAFSQSHGDYSTLRSREEQWAATLDMIEPATLLVGNGFSTMDLPLNRPIHDTLIAAVYHFGLLGLASQILLLAFFMVRLRHHAPTALRSILLGVIIIFTFSYLTGPGLSRRSLWAPPLLLGAYLTTRKQATTSPLQAAAGQLNSGPLNSDSLNLGAKGRL